MRRDRQSGRDVAAGKRWAEYVADFLKDAAKKKLAAAMVRGKK